MADTFAFTQHALEEMKERGIAKPVVISVLNEPDQIVPGYGGRVCHQSVIRMRGKNYLIRVIVDEREDPIRVITVYRTSQIKRYWSES